MVGELLTSVYQATDNSATVTRAAARSVASALGARHLELDVEPLVTSYVAMVEKAMGRPLTWEHDDVALQNIQARVRAPASGCWRTCAARCCSRPATAARRPSATRRWTATPAAGSARSPASTRPSCATGCVDGDHGPGRAGPDARARRGDRAAADRRAAAAGQQQTDEDDLMPYDVLDAIERLAIRDKHVPLEVLSELAATFPAASGRAAGPVGRALLRSGAATSGSASATRRPSTSTTRTSIRRRGAASRSCREASERELAELQDAQGPDHR